MCRWPAAHSVPGMTAVLVAHASKHGSTRSVAESVAATLRDWQAIRTWAEGVATGLAGRVLA
jgi:hypothetical protein